MRPFTVLATALLAATAFSGCSTSASGTWFGLHVAEAGGAGEFRRLTVEVSKVTLIPAGGGAAVEVAPQQPSFDLAKLANGNVSSLFSGRVEPGQYKRIELSVVKATGVLQADGRLVNVAVPGGKLAIDLDLDVASREVNYRMGLQVAPDGAGHKLVADPLGSKIITKPVNGKSRDL